MIRLKFFFCNLSLVFNQQGVSYNLVSAFGGSGAVDKLKIKSPSKNQDFRDFFYFPIQVGVFPSKKGLNTLDHYSMFTHLI